MAGFIGMLKRLYTVSNPPRATSPDESSVIKFGILGAANIGPAALILPARSHPEVVVYAVAGRSQKKTQAYAVKYDIEMAYGGPTAYQDLLDDPNVEAVYIPLPNALHYEWTMKAISAGKHVLLEKPSADRASETREMFEYAEKKGLVLLEAFHYRFHPALQRAKEIIDSGELGPIKHIEARMVVPQGLIKDDDIRFQHDLGGGAMMDNGCYTMNCLRYFASSNPTRVDSALPRIMRPNTPGRPALIDSQMSAELTFPNDVTGSFVCDLRHPPKFGIIPKLPEMNLRVECQGGELFMYNFVMPSLYHYIQVTQRNGEGRKEKKRVEKLYKPKTEERKGEDWWSTYRYQLEVFVDRVKGRKTDTWLTAQHSVDNMIWVEKVYEQSGLGARPKSSYKVLEC